MNIILPPAGDGAYDLALKLIVAMADSKTVADNIEKTIASQREQKFAEVEAQKAELATQRRNVEAEWAEARLLRSEYESKLAALKALADG